MKTMADYLLAGLTLSAAVSALAGPPSQFLEPLRREQPARALQPREHVVYVCRQCQPANASPADRASAMPAMDRCREGTKVTCPSCRPHTRVVFQGLPKSPSVVREVTYTNERGDSCIFVAQVVRSD